MTLDCWDPLFFSVKRFLATVGVRGVAEPRRRRTGDESALIRLLLAGHPLKSPVPQGWGGARVSQGGWGRGGCWVNRGMVAGEGVSQCSSCPTLFNQCFCHSCTKCSEHACKKHETVQSNKCIVQKKKKTTNAKWITRKCRWPAGPSHPAGF